MNIIHKKKIVLCVAIPHEKKQFESWCLRRSDFWRQLCEQYGTNDNVVLWEKYHDTAAAIDKCIRQLTDRGVYVFDEFCSAQLPYIVDSDVIIVMAHKQTMPDAVELWDKTVAPDEFVDNIPTTFSGTIDMCCCYSLDILNRLKLRCPDHEYLIASKEKTLVKIHATLLPFIVDDMGFRFHRSYFLSFRKIYKLAEMRKQKMEKERDEELRKLEERRKELEGEQSSTLVAMGGESKDMSTLYAPKSALAGEVFYVQMYFHHIEDSEEIEIRAKSKDETAVMKESKSLKLRLKEGDRIAARLHIENNQNNDFEICSDDVYASVWDDTIDGATFRVLVNQNCKKKRCECSIQVFVNDQRTAEMLFPVVVVHEDKDRDTAPTCIEFVKTKKDYKQAAYDELRNILMQRLNQVSTIDAEKKVISRCLDLLNSCIHDGCTCNKVFISSTGDLQEARRAVQDGINALEMSLIPIMYEHWNADSLRPCDKCSEKVMESDYFVLILGKEYGHVERELGLSMTLIEYLVAVFCNKPIYAFIDKETAGMKNIEAKQAVFINRVKEELLMCEYYGVDDLRLKVKEALGDAVRKNSIHKTQ